MDTSKGSLILKAISAEADEARLAEYLAKRAKSIPPGKIPVLFKNLPVVLSRNVPEPIGSAVIDQLKQLGAQTLFLPAQDSTGTIPSDPPTTPATPEDSSGQWTTGDRTHLGFRLLRDSVLQVASRHTRQRKAVEILLILLCLAMAGALNYIVASHTLLLDLFTLPTILAAFFFGRRQAFFAALTAMVLVGTLFGLAGEQWVRVGLAGPVDANQWVYLLCWGGVLLAIAFLAGTLHTRQEAGAQELRRLYHGLILILKHSINKDAAKDSHAFRVSVYAARIATQMGLAKEFIQDIRTAARLLEIGQPAIGRTVLA